MPENELHLELHLRSQNGTVVDWQQPLKLSHYRNGQTENSAAYVTETTATQVTNSEIHKLCVIQPVPFSFNSYSLESIFFTFSCFRILYSVLTLKEFIDINIIRVKISMTFYTVDQLHDSKRLHCSRLSCKVQFSDHVMSFSRHNYAIMSLPAKLANKLSFLFTPRRQSPPESLLAG